MRYFLTLKKRCTQIFNRQIFRIKTKIGWDQIDPMLVDKFCMNKKNYLKIANG